MEEAFSIKWTEFHKNISQSFNELREEETFFDVTLIAEDEVQIQAHKLVLSAGSDFFKSILLKNSHLHPLIYLSGKAYIFLPLSNKWVMNINFIKSLRMSSMSAIQNIFVLK